MSVRLLLLLALSTLVSGLTDSERSCVATNAGALDNEFLVGTWYEVYRFAGWLNLPASSSCGVVRITRASAADVAEYRAAHGDDGPFTFDASAVLVDRHDGYFTGMLTGGDQVKFYAWDPKSVFFSTQAYEARVYKKVNEEYMLFNTCAIPSTKVLLSRRRDQTAQELLDLIATIDDVRGLQTQRFCAP